MKCECGSVRFKTVVKGKKWMCRVCGLIFTIHSLIERAWEV